MRKDFEQPTVPTLSLRWSGEGIPPFETGVPILAGAAATSRLRGMQPTGDCGCVQLLRGEDWIAGHAKGEVGLSLEHATRAIYSDLLRAARGWHLARCWNYVPGINEPDADGLECYRIFSRERSLAFEGEFGPGFRSALPAASAVGTQADTLRVAFVATRNRTTHFENPRQVPAYHYPAEYGPRSPSFARATVVQTRTGREVFISGTSAVVGHMTISPGDTAAQLEHAVANLREISRACGIGHGLGAGEARHREFTVYLRHAHELGATRAYLEQGLLNPSDSVVFTRADICRASLNVEIEAWLGF